MGSRSHHTLSPIPRWSHLNLVPSEPVWTQEATEVHALHHVCSPGSAETGPRSLSPSHTRPKTPFVGLKKREDALSPRAHGFPDLGRTPARRRWQAHHYPNPAPPPARGVAYNVVLAAVPPAWPSPWCPEKFPAAPCHSLFPLPSTWDSPHTCLDMTAGG